jgi:hypothetical protein
MKLKCLATFICTTLAAVHVYAEPLPSSSQQNPSPSVGANTSSQIQGANTNVNTPAAQPVQGANANGLSQMNVVDQNGNLKIINNNKSATQNYPKTTGGPPTSSRTCRMRIYQVNLMALFSQPIRT